MAWYTRAQARANPLKLTGAEADALLSTVTDRVERVTARYITLMGEHIRDIGKLTASDVHRLQQFTRMNINMDVVRRQLASAANISLEELERIYRKVAETDIRMARDILGFHGAADMESNLAYKSIIRAQAQETYSAMRNLANSSVMSQYYQDAVDDCVFAVQNGVEDYNTAIRRVVRQAGNAGLKIVEYESGLHRRVDTAARMNVLDGVRHLNQSIMEEVGREFGADGVEISAHMLCAEDHLPYQGQQFSNAAFEQLQASLARPFGEWNCRHSWHPIILGISPPRYTEDHLMQYQAFTNEIIEIDGREKNRYGWSQEMRRCETAVRQAKDCANLAATTEDMVLRRQCQKRIDALQEYYYTITDITKLPPEASRMSVPGFHKVKAS